MMKRVTWFVAGAAAGIGGSAFAKRKAREMAERYTPVSVAGRAVDAARGKGRSVVYAVREGRIEARRKEIELRALLDEPDAIVGEARPLVSERRVAIEVVESGSTRWRDRPSGPRRRGRHRTG
jgi:hypothetical protein